MKVRELIEKLEKVDGSKEVVIQRDDNGWFEPHNVTVVKGEDEEWLVSINWAEWGNE